jgi:protoporphyrinogen oxidase
MLAGCLPARERNGSGPASRWLGVSHKSGHRLREGLAMALPGSLVQHHIKVLIVGAGIAGLACARRLQQRGIHDICLLDLEAEAGGNSRGHQMHGLHCPLGAHYLPVPGADVPEITQWLVELGVGQYKAGQLQWDERHLCHSPQERLLIQGHWVEGLLPPIEALPHTEQATTRQQYRALAREISRLQQTLTFRIPTHNAAFSDALKALDRQTFAQWLQQHGFTAPALRWYMDYCCLDDYGASSERVSAWAGLHYFASRHGFQDPEDPSHTSTEPILTWAQGNAWLSARLIEPLKAHLRLGHLVMRVDEQKHSVVVDSWDVAQQQGHRWHAQHVVMALPLFIAQRLLVRPIPALQALQNTIQYAPWAVANAYCTEPLKDRAGAAPAWDSVIYDPQWQQPMLGYVDSRHQSTSPLPGPTVLTFYWALGGRTAQQAQEARRHLLNSSAADWSQRLTQTATLAHPDLKQKIKEIDWMRYGHAMSIPTPGLRSHPALAALQQNSRRLHWAHSDLSGYSIFEEAFFHGHRVGEQISYEF